MDSFTNNILLSNLTRIRWIAIIGQFLAIIFVFYYLNIEIPIYPCLLVILISVLINSYSFLNNKADKYLSDKQAFSFLIFDTIQLSILLFLTGGIYNPFSLLLIAPLIISASYLPIFYSICLLLLSLLSVIIISKFFISIQWNQLFEVPLYFAYGLTIALVISLVFIFIYVYLFASSSRKLSTALSETQSALSDQKKISEIGSLSAAAAHELSTPLNTIFLVLNDLKENKFILNNSSIAKEIGLLKSEAERCKEILLTLSKNPENLKDNFLDKTKISNIIKLNFDKFNSQNIKLKLNMQDKNEEPLIQIKDELIYCFGNIVQNAVQHARNVINVEIKWDIKEFLITIEDDGIGFKNDILEKVGQPYISKKENGMGLGIFIAKNLIENIGGTITFSNNKNKGAKVEIKIFRVT